MFAQCSEGTHLSHVLFLCHYLIIKLGSLTRLACIKLNCQLTTVDALHLLVNQSEVVVVGAVRKRRSGVVQITFTSRPAAASDDQYSLITLHSFDVPISSKYPPKFTISI
jgi:hypothetical protein